MLAAQAAKRRGLDGAVSPLHPVNSPALNPSVLMPQTAPNGLAALSLFSGGGGLDLGFDRAGYTHCGSFDALPAAGETLLANRPGWSVHAGEHGDVRDMDWGRYRGEVDVLHGGPPCQPFSAAGRQRGAQDERNMLPEFVRAVREIAPAAFVAENVPALAGPKFAPYLREALYGPLEGIYTVTVFPLAAQHFGVPQARRRVFIIGFRSKQAARWFTPPAATHRTDHLDRTAPPLATADLPLTPGAREALGLPDIGFDGLAPTLRSGLTGPRRTTSVLASASAQRVWARLRVWPNGVAETREAAQRFPAENGHFRMALPDCALLQGFPADWRFAGPATVALGQIGNSVAPPVAWHVACAVADALHGTGRRCSPSRPASR